MFIYFDADDIGNHLELLLLDGKLEMASDFSQKLTNAMFEMQKSLCLISGVKIHLFGGDDLIAEFTNPLNTLEQIELFREQFKIQSGVTISAGIGENIENALTNLRRAKLLGKNRLVGTLD